MGEHINIKDEAGQGNPEPRRGSSAQPDPRPPVATN